MGLVLELNYYPLLEMWYLILRKLMAFLILQVCQVSMPTLTLARYILETSLMEYKFNVVLSESLLAAATLVLAMKVTRNMVLSCYTIGPPPPYPIKNFLGETDWLIM